MDMYKESIECNARDLSSISLRIRDLITQLRAQEGDKAPVAHKCAELMAQVQQLERARLQHVSALHIAKKQWWDAEGARLLEEQQGHQHQHAHGGDAAVVESDFLETADVKLRGRADDDDDHDHDHDHGGGHQSANEDDEDYVSPLARAALEALAEVRASEAAINEILEDLRAEQADLVDYE